MIQVTGNIQTQAMHRTCSESISESLSSVTTMGILHERHVIITGFGGQEIIMAGDILGRAASLYDHKYVTMMQTYGPEVWGSCCSARVIISKKEILFPYVRETQVLICMSQDGYSRNIGYLHRGGTLIWDTDLVETKDPDPSWATCHIPATRLALELGDRSMATVVMLGFLTVASDLVSAQSMREAVLTYAPVSPKEITTRAFERGREYGRTVLKRRLKGERIRDSRNSSTSVQGMNRG